MQRSLTFDGDSPGILHDSVGHLGVGDAADEVFEVVLPTGVQRQHADRLVPVPRCLRENRETLLRVPITLTIGKCLR